MVKLWVLIFSLLLTGLSQAQTSGGGPTTHSPTLSVTDGTNTCYPYQIKVGSNSCTSGIATISTGGGGGGSGTVTTGSIYQVAYYPSSSNTVQGAANFYNVGNNVGIGTITPANLLSVGSTSQVQISNSGTITTSGNVGIGTTDTSEQLIVYTSPTSVATISNGLIYSSFELDTDGNIFADSGTIQGKALRIAQVTVPSEQVNVFDSGFHNAFNISGDLVTMRGNVGIGTTFDPITNPPGARLDINGTTRMTGFIDTKNPSSGYVMTSDGSGNGTWQPVGGGISGLTTGKIPQAASSTTLSDSVITQLSSNIGIGTTLPSQLLEVGARKFDVTSAGNVGIGTINPITTLQVNGSVKVNTTLQSNAYAYPDGTTWLDSSKQTHYPASGNIDLDSSDIHYYPNSVPVYDGTTLYYQGPGNLPLADGGDNSGHTHLYVHIGAPPDSELCVCSDSVTVGYCTSIPGITCSCSTGCSSC